jgi:hypothetical protein
MRRLAVCVWVCSTLAGCANDLPGGTQVFSATYASGFFGGMHSFPYSTRLAPGRIYATDVKSVGPTFGAGVVELCENDTDAMRAKFPDVMKTRSFETSESVTKQMGKSGEFSLEGIKLPFVDIGASTKYVSDIKYEFKKVKEIEVSEEAQAFVRANIKQSCREVIARQQKAGRWVFFARTVVQPEKSTVAMTYKPEVGGSLGVTIAKGISPKITAKTGTSRTETTEAANKVVEVKGSGFGKPD